MARYWVMAPAEYSPSGAIGAEYQKCWQYDLEHGVIFMGWDLGAAPRSREHLHRLWDTNANPGWEGSPEHAIRMLSSFWFDVEPGDMVIARAGPLHYVGVGEFQGEPYYDPGGAGLTWWEAYFRRVRWEPTPGMRRSPVRFGRFTLYPLAPEKAALFR